MNKAEQRADVYAKSRQRLGYDYCSTFDAVKYGYLQAEKDLALTWKDMETIDNCFHSVAKDQFSGELKLSSMKEMYEEVLRRFNEQRGKK